jgi:hypothetical protein
MLHNAIFATCGLHILIIYWQTIISSYHKRKCLYEALLKLSLSNICIIITAMITMQFDDNHSSISNTFQTPVGNMVWSGAELSIALVTALCLEVLIISLTFTTFAQSTKANFIHINNER